MAIPLLATCSCLHRHSFEVVPAQPDYLLRSPDKSDTPFEEVLKTHTGVGWTWVELQPGMELRIEKAYFRGGDQQATNKNYLGTELARYGVQSNGNLELLFLGPEVAERPRDQESVKQNGLGIEWQKEFPRTVFRSRLRQKGREAKRSSPECRLFTGPRRTYCPAASRARGRLPQRQPELHSFSHLVHCVA
jgi:hypothetical protein